MAKSILEAKIVIEEGGNIVFYSEEPNIAVLVTRFLDQKFEEQFKKGKEEGIRNILKNVEKLANNTL